MSQKLESKTSEEEDIAKAAKSIMYEEVTVRVPKPILRFLKDMEKALDQTVEEFIETSVVEMVESQLAGGGFFNPNYILEKYDLKPTFKAYDVLQCSY